MKKKLIAGLLAIVMLITVIPFTVTRTVASAGADVTVYSWSELKEEISGATEPKVIALGNDIAAQETDDYFFISSGQEITLDLNGYKIDRALTEYKTDGHVFFINGKLTIMDSSDAGKNGTGTGMITGGMGSTNSTSRSGAMYVNYGELILESGNITGNRCQSYGGGVYVTSAGEFVMNGGAITNNISSDSTYGGAGVITDGDFIMNGGVISGNILDVDDTAAGGGGGVAAKCGKFVMNGGTIENNYSGSRGGGLFIYDYTGSDEFACTLSGESRICGNISGKTEEGPDDVYLGDTAPIRLGGEDGLTGKARIGIRAKGSLTETGSFTFVKTMSGSPVPTVLHASHFFADDADAFCVALNGDKIQLKYLMDETKYKITYNANGSDKTAPTDTKKYVYGQIATLMDGEALSYDCDYFAGWNTKYDGSGETFESGAPMQISGNVTLYAKYKHCHDDIEFEDCFGLPSAPGNYRLIGNILTSEGWVAPQGVTNLCLDGHTYQKGGEDFLTLITVPAGATLNIYDCDNTERYGHIDETTKLWVWDYDKQTNNLSVYGGLILGGDAQAISLNGKSYREGGGICVQGGILNIYGGNIAGCNCQDGGYKFYSGGGGVAVCNGGTFNMYGGTITGCTVKCTLSGSNIRGAAVHVAADSAFNMYDGATIQYCSAVNTNSYGGAIGLCDVGTNSANIIGGTIKNCSAVASGGAVFSDKTSGAVNIKGGKITGCTAGSNGGAVFAKVVNMTGGEISGNTASGNGGGAYVYDTFCVGGTAVIKDNFKGENINNLFLPDKKVLVIGSGAQKPTTMSIGVLTATAPVEDVPVPVTLNGSAEDIAKFIPDDDTYVMLFDTDHLVLSTRHEHNFTGDYVNYDTVNKKWAKKCKCGEYDTENALTGADIPKAQKDLIYNAGVQTGVLSSKGYTVSGNTGTDAGDGYVATAKLVDGYIWSDGTFADKEIPWSIKRAALTEAGVESMEYTGRVLTPVVTVKAGDLDATYDAGEWSGELLNPGTYTMTVTGKGNFTGTKEVSFTITHTHGLVPVSGQAPTKESPGWKSYYECKDFSGACHKYFEDEEGLIPIDELGAWKAFGGRGFVEKLASDKAISGVVTQNDKRVTDAVVELYAGSSLISTTKTDAYGYYSFDKVDIGDYNIVVSSNGKTETSLVSVRDTEPVNADVILYENFVSSKVEHIGDKPKASKISGERIVVGGLDEVALSLDLGRDERAVVKLQVEAKENGNTKEQLAINALLDEGKLIEFLEFTLTKQINQDNPIDIGDKNEKILTIIVPFDFADVEASSVEVVRYHDKAEKLTKNPADGQEGFIVNEKAGTITILAKKFSTYGIAYDPKKDIPCFNQGGSGNGMTLFGAVVVLLITVFWGSLFYKKKRRNIG